jgi:hypothetical protein
MMVALDRQRQVLRDHVARDALEVGFRAVADGTRLASVVSHDESH